MTVDMRCQDKERLIAYLYGEDSPEEREGVERHLAVCRSCADEVEGLRAAREGLAGWQAPEVALGFRLVREPLKPARRAGWGVPAWAALPAAAAVILAAGAAIANLEIRYGADGFAVRTGWQRTLPATAPAPMMAVVPGTPADDAWREALAATERRLREELASALTTASSVTPARVSSGSGIDMAQVRALIEASERRQQRELALRLAEVVQDLEAQRRADLVQIDENLGHLEGLTAARQREVMNYLVRVAEGR
ncbi:MAG TPA: zf-HC2 domain-containing protein [Vicinamibacterales bacterium]|nr:zf-HC2 domain-containing protein [Vicinamibacterales bacterium]